MGRGSTEAPQRTTEAKPLRRDAEANLARILVAARDVFAEHGYEASMEQIAARAEVGIGTALPAQGRPVHRRGRRGHRSDPPDRARGPS